MMFLSLHMTTVLLWVFFSVDLLDADREGDANQMPTYPCPVAVGGGGGGVKNALTIMYSAR